MGKLFLGLDMSLTGTGAAIIDDDYQIVKIEKFSVKITTIERLFHLRNKLESFLDGYDISLSCIEGYAYGKREGKVFEIGEWGGVAKLFLFEHGYEFISATPMQGKKYITGQGDSTTTKELIILDIYKKWGIEIRENNMADAYVLARIAKDYFNKEKNLTTYQQEVIKAITKSISDGNIGVYLK